MGACKYSKAFHLFALAHFYYALYYDFTVIAPLEMEVRGYTFGGPWVYITILTNAVQVIYYAITLATDFAPFDGLKKLRNYVFAAFALPLALETSFMYWAMVTIDRELVFPKALDEFFPRWLDIMLHTNVTVFAFVELFIMKHQYPRRKSALRGLTLFLFGYLIWLYVIKGNTGKWVYGIMEVLSGPQRILFFLAGGLVSVGLYFIGEFSNKLVSGSQTAVKSVKKKSQ